MSAELIIATVGGAAAFTGLGSTLKSRVSSTGEAYTTDGQMRRDYAISLSTIIYNMGSNYHQYNLTVADFDWGGLANCLTEQTQLLDSQIPESVGKYRAYNEAQVANLKDNFNNAITATQYRLGDKQNDQRFSVEEIDDAKAEKAVEFFRGNYFRHISDIIIDKVDFNDWLTRQLDLGVKIPEAYLNHDAVKVTDWDRMFARTVKEFRRDLGMGSDSPMAITNTIEGYCAGDLAFGLINGKPKTYEGKYNVGRTMHGNNAFDKIDVSRFVANANKTDEIKKQFRKAFGINGEITEESLRKSEKFLHAMSDATIRQGTDVQGGIARLFGGMTTEDFLDAFTGDGIAGVQGKSLFIDFWDSFKDGINKSILAFEKNGKIPIPSEKIIVNGMSHPGGYWNIKDFLASEEGNDLAKFYTGREFDYKNDKSFTQSDAILLQQVILTDVLERSGMARRFSGNGATTVHAAIQTARVAIALGVPVSKEFSEMNATSANQTSAIPVPQHPKTHMVFAHPDHKKFNAGVVAFLDNAPGDPHDLDVAMDKMGFVSGPRRIIRPAPTKLPEPVAAPSIMRLSPNTTPENAPAGTTLEYDPSVLHIQLTYKYSQNNTAQRKQIPSILKAPFAWVNGLLDDVNISQGVKTGLKILAATALTATTALYSPVVALAVGSMAAYNIYNRRSTSGRQLLLAGLAVAGNEGVKALQDPVRVINEGSPEYAHYHQLSVEDAARYNSTRWEVTTDGDKTLGYNGNLMVIRGGDTSFVVPNNPLHHKLFKPVFGQGGFLGGEKNPGDITFNAGAGINLEYYKLPDGVVVTVVNLDGGKSITFTEEKNWQVDPSKTVKNSGTSSLPSAPEQKAPVPTSATDPSKMNRVSVDDAFYVYTGGGNAAMKRQISVDDLNTPEDIQNFSLKAGKSVLIDEIIVTAGDQDKTLYFAKGAKYQMNLRNGSDAIDKITTEDFKFEVEVNGARKTYDTVDLETTYNISSTDSGKGYMHDMIPDYNPAVYGTLHDMKYFQDGNHITIIPKGFIEQLRIDPASFRVNQASIG